MEYGAALQRKDTVGQRQHEVEVVLDNDDGDVLPPGVEHAVSNFGLVDLVFLVTTFPVSDDKPI